MADAKPALCPKCGAAATFVACPACGAVFWKELAGWTAGLSAAATVCLLVVGYAASVWLKAGAGAAMLGCVGGLAWVRVSLLRAARLRSPHWDSSTQWGGAGTSLLRVARLRSPHPPSGEAETPLHVRLWTAATAVLLGVSITAGLALYDAADARSKSQAAHKPPAEPPAAKSNPLPVAVTFRPQAGGTGQAVFLAGAPGGKPLTVRVTTAPPTGTDPKVMPVPVGRSPLNHWLGAGLALWQIGNEADEKWWLEQLCSADVLVRPGVETEVNWRGGRRVPLPPGKAVTLTCPGYDPLTTSASVPLRHPPPGANAPAATPPPKTDAEALKELDEIGKQLQKAQTMIATTLLMDDKFDDAIKEFDAVLRADPKDVYALNGRGFAHAGKGDLTRAFVDLDASVRARPEWAPTYRLRGQALFVRKEYRAALGEYTHAIRLDPKAGVGLLWPVRDPFSAHLERALVRLEMGEWDGAVGDCDAELRLNPNSYEAYGLRARAHQKLGNDAAARADVARATELRDARKKR